MLSRRQSVLLTSLTYIVVFTGLLIFNPTPVLAADPQLPETFQVPYQLPTGGTTYHVHQGDNLQTAINSANLGDVIVLDAGATFTGNFTLPNKTGSGWIYIISSELSSLPTEGTRVGSADAAYMPKITDSSGGRPLVSLFGAHHYRFAGIEINTTSNSTTMVMFGSDNAGHYAHTLSDLPHDITFDRCYMHSTSESNYARVGILLDGRYMAVVDSYISNFKDSADAQAILVWNGVGPFKIVNNYLESTGENFMSGGADPQITHATDPTNYPDVDMGSVPSDIEIKGNYFYKPNTWNQFSPEYNGHDWVIKNSFEIKNAQRVLIEGNIFDNCWPDAQTGRAIVLKAANQSGTANWSKSWDVTFQNNIIRNATGGIDFVGSQNPVSGSTCAGMKRVLVRDNLADLTSTDSWVGTLFLIGFSAGDVVATDIAVDHNTMIGKINANLMVSAGDIANQFDHITITNNIMRHGQYGFKGSGVSEGTATMDRYLTDYSYLKNLMVDLASPGSAYPANNFNTAGATISTVGFTDYANANYKLTPQSPYHNQGTDGADIGPAWDTLTDATVNTESGNRPTYTITPTAGSNGTISPSDVTDVIQGDNQSFTITPNTNYHIQSITVDGTDTGTATSPYIFTSVTTNHTITATFAADPTPSPSPSPVIPLTAILSISPTTYTVQAGHSLDIPITATLTGTGADTWISQMVFTLTNLTTGLAQFNLRVE